MNPGPDNQAQRDPAAVHAAWMRHYEREIERHERRERTLGAMRFVFFLAAGILISAGVSANSPLQWGAGIVAFVLFLASWAYRAVPAREAAQLRREVHKRHLARLSGKWQTFACKGEGLLPTTHPYAFDLDIIGQGSLFQRIDVTQTVRGEQLLADWLGQAADPQEITARQQAVAELAEQLELRRELEATALGGSLAHGKLDGRSFADFAELPSLFAAHAWLAPTIYALPICTAVLFVLGSLAVVPPGLWLLPVVLQVGLLQWSSAAVRRAFDLSAARQGVAEAFEGMLRTAERADWASSRLQAIKARLAVDDVAPSVHMRRLKAWASAAELRQQALFYIFINPLTLWDLHVLHGLERWNQRVGRRTTDWFTALGELEALCSLAGFAHGDPDCKMPEIAAPDAALEAEGLAHPLLSPATRVANDLSLDGPGSALIVTGSNMAGKSTLLRAVGLNVALALAGAPVCARRMRVPRNRLRASIRIQDSLQAGASYFHAELSNLRKVVVDAEQEPPVLFLLDELLRGTNARARHIGAKSVLLHLIERGASGMVATHDLALTSLADSHPDRVRNVHFTDVVIDGEMRFDYKLRPGAVKSSNALRLLALAGIEVPADEAERMEVLETETTTKGLSPEGAS